MKCTFYLDASLAPCSRAQRQVTEKSHLRKPREGAISTSNLGTGNRYFGNVAVRGNSGGPDAALATERIEARTALIEDAPTPGCVPSSGISDTFSLEPLGGILEEPRLRVRTSYTATDPGGRIFRTRRSASHNLYSRSKRPTFPRELGRREPHAIDRFSVDMFYAEIPAGANMHGYRSQNVQATNKPEGMHRLPGHVVTDSTLEENIPPRRRVGALCCMATCSLVAAVGRPP